MTKNRKNICIITSSLLIVKFFLQPHLKMLSKHYDITLLINIDDAELLSKLNLNPDIKVVHIPIGRKISILRDILTLVLVLKYFLTHSCDLVFTVGPKAGFIGINAAWAARVKRRVHIFQGEVWLNSIGIKRLILKNLDRILSYFSTHLLVVSESERKFLIEQSIISKSKSRVLGSGSICGVDLSKFKVNPVQRKAIREEWGIPENNVLFLFVGRINPDKGVDHLINAFAMLFESSPGPMSLMIIGPDEGGLSEGFGELAKPTKAHIHYLPTLVHDPENYMAAADVLILPSHREGFGLVIIEAAALGIPSIGSRIYGITDAIIEGQTGLLFETRNEKDLMHNMKLLLNSEYRQKLSENARKNCEENFSQDFILKQYEQFFEKLLHDI